MTDATVLAIVSLPDASRAFLRQLLRRGTRWSADGGREAIAEAWAHFAANENGRAMAAPVHEELTACWKARTASSPTTQVQQSNTNRVG